MKKILFIATIVMVIGGLALVFFGRNLLKKAKKEVTNMAAEEVLKQQTGADVDMDVDFDTNQGKMSLSKDGSTIQFSGEDELPENFPQDIPIYRDSKVEAGLSASSDTNENAGGLTVALTSPSSIENIYAFYLAKLVGNGWNLETKIESEGRNMLGASKDDRQIVVTIQPGEAENETRIGILTYTKTEETGDPQNQPPSGTSP